MNPSDVRPRVFRGRVRLKQSIFAEGFSTKTGKHRGIGLALVARLCRQHGGAVTLEESELGGACFIAVLDRSLCAEAATEPAPS